MILPFLSTLSLRRATTGFDSGTMVPAISIHALLAESDGGTIRRYFVRRRFLSTLSLRRATQADRVQHHRRNISIHALLAESDGLPGNHAPGGAISIHALLAESDFDIIQILTRYTFISIHALLAESDCSGRLSLNGIRTFLSTLSLRRATVPFRGHDFWSRYFYPRSPCGERRCRPGNCTKCCAFLSTLSLRRATAAAIYRRSGMTDHFYPRSPCGERPEPVTIQAPRPVFLSTLSLRRATLVTTHAGFYAPISIHALLAESDPAPVPCGHDADISIHALLAESDRECC